MTPLYAIFDTLWEEAELLAYGPGGILAAFTSDTAVPASRPWP